MITLDLTNNKNYELISVSEIDYIINSYLFNVFGNMGYERYTVIYSGNYPSDEVDNIFLLVVTDGLFAYVMKNGNEAQ